MSTPRLTDLSGELLTAGFEIAGRSSMRFLSADRATNWQSSERDDHRRVIAAAELPFPLVEVQFADLGDSGLPTDERGLTPVSITLVDDEIKEDKDGVPFVTSKALQLEVTTADEFAFRMKKVSLDNRLDAFGAFKSLPPRQGPHIALRTEVHVQRHDQDRRHRPDGYSPRVSHEVYKPSRMKTYDIYKRDFWAPFYAAYEARAQAVLKRAQEVTSD